MNYMNDMPSFFSIEDLKRYGIPMRIDSADLTLTQGKVLVGLIGQVFVQGMKLAEAIEIALPAFKESYKLENGRWYSNKFISIAGKTIRSKFYKEDDGMGRARRDHRTEAGKRNSKKDREAIKKIIKSALSQLGDDGNSILAELGLKVAK